jgi:hypothetical protein
MDELENQFNEAVKRLKAYTFDATTTPGSLRWKLYGLQKQALEGNCKLILSCHGEIFCRQTTLSTKRECDIIKKMGILAEL